jgi:hypothetical protein
LTFTSGQREPLTAHRGRRSRRRPSPLRRLRRYGRRHVLPLLAGVVEIMRRADVKRFGGRARARRARRWPQAARARRQGGWSGDSPCDAFMTRREYHDMRTVLSPGSPQRKPSRKQCRNEHPAPCRGNIDSFNQGWTAKSAAGLRNSVHLCELRGLTKRQNMLLLCCIIAGFARRRHANRTDSLCKLY